MAPRMHPIRRTSERVMELQALSDETRSRLGREWPVPPGHEALLVEIRHACDRQLWELRRLQVVIAVHLRTMPDGPPLPPAAARWATRRQAA